jgi:methyl-accepting chemotaxis protein
MRITVGKRLFLLSSAAICAAVAIGFSGIKGIRESHSALEEVVTYAKGQANFLQSDMMHDAIRADVLRALLATDDGEYNEAKKELDEHVQSFRDSMAANAELPLTPEVLKG